MLRRGAFTIIEVLISVVLMMIVVLGILKLFGENRSLALYLTERSKNELSNTLFLSKEATRYDGEKKDAYALLSTTFKINDFTSREILKEMERTITLSEPFNLSEDSLPVEVNEIMLKGDYSSRFFHFETK